LQEGVKIAVTDNELRNTGSQQRRGRLSSEDTDAADACEQILQELPTPATLVGYRLTPIEFEKDDERNFHVEFVAAAANLRAQNYGIPATDKLEVECELPISLPFFFVLFPWSFFYMSNHWTCRG
jgi:ubiquitin-activating enzyme E1